MAARVLIVEDNQANMDLMCYLLAAFGHTPLSAYDGLQGVVAARELQPDLIICDIHLPRLDGYGVVALLKGDAATAGIPVLAASALPVSDGGAALRAAGFDDADALLPFEPAEQPAYRLLSEYFAYPEKFDFIDIELAELLRHAAPGCASITLHLPLNGVRADSSAARILRTLTRDNLLLSCTPIVNLFRHIATPIQITHTQSTYPLLPDALPARATADELNLFAPLASSVLTSRIPAHLRTADWAAFSTRARVIVYNKKTVNAA
eukprot:gene28857-32591_t